MKELPNLDQRAADLRRLLKKFGSEGVKIGTGIKELLAFIDTNVDRDVIEELTRSNETANTELKNAADNTLYTPVEINHEVVVPWNGSYVLIAIDKNYQVVSSASNPPSAEIQEKFYGDRNFNFWRVALKKAVAGKLLQDVGRSGGITENLKWLEGLGYSHHEGAAIAELDERTFYLGASGCEATGEGIILSMGYRKNRKPEETAFEIEAISHFNDLDGHFVHAGDFDRAFATVAGRYLREPGRIKTAPVTDLSFLTAKN